MNGLVILGGEIIWTGKKPELVKSNIDWDALKQRHVSCGIALRIASYPGPFAADDGPARFILSVAKSLLIEAEAYGLKLNEFQLVRPKNYSLQKGKKDDWTKTRELFGVRTPRKPTSKILPMR